MSRASPVASASPNKGVRLPLSYAQQSYWYLYLQGLGAESGDNIGVKLHYHGRLDAELLEWSIEQVVLRHEALRTRFDMGEDYPFQTIGDAPCVRITRESFEHLPEKEREAAAHTKSNSEFNEPFDLRSNTLTKFVLYKISPEHHLLLFCAHHIVCDGWSAGVISREIRDFYDAGYGNQPDSLKNPPVQYREFVKWEHTYLESFIRSELLPYWEKKLAGEIPVLELPADPSQQVQEAHYAGRSLRFQLDPDLTRDAERFCRERGTTFYLLIQTAFSCLLHRYSGQEELIIGTVLANRRHKILERKFNLQDCPSTRRTVGQFANIVPLRTSFPSDLSFWDLLDQIQQTAQEAAEHQEVPFNLILHSLQANRPETQTGLVQAMLTFLNHSLVAEGVPGVEKRFELPELQAKANLDLVFDIWHAENAEGMVMYRADLFAESTVRRMVNHFCCLIKAAIRDPEASIRDLPMMDAQERQALLEFCTTPLQTEAEPLPVHQRFEEQARLHPERVAAKYGDQEICYRELNETANRLARHLRDQGIHEESPVVICGEKSFELLIAVLAILKAGGAYVPITPNKPLIRIQKIVQNVEAFLLLDQSGLDPMDFTDLCGFQNLDALLASLPPSNPATTSDLHLAVEADQLAYCIFTSGSTGEPKGVLIPHGSLSQQFQGWEEVYRLSTDVSRFLQLASFSFDVFTEDWTRALCSGGTLVFCPPETILDPGALVDLIQREQIDFVELVPAVVRSLIEHLGKDACERPLRGLRILISGAEKIYLHELNRIASFCGEETRIINSYGITEATIDNCWFELGQVDWPEDHIAPVGRPFSGSQVYICDDQLRLAPPGIYGEICLGGACLARGYLNRDELTKERFVPCPDLKGERLYRSGDRGRMLADGTIEVCGRLDHQIKLRGFRIEPSDIETPLRELDAVQDVVVIARENRMGTAELHAYLLRSGEDQPSDSAMVQLLEERLPPYMIPAKFLWLDQFPQTASGKINRPALPIQDAVPQHSETAFEAPRSMTEQSLARIWSAVLEREQISVHDNFFRLGGHSLLAIRVFSRIRQDLGLELPLATLFENPTLAQLAARIDRDRSVLGVSQGPSLVAIPRTETNVLSPSQERMWFLQEYEPNSVAYSLGTAGLIPFAVDLQTFREAVDLVVRRHEALRTSFEAKDGVPFQKVHAEPRYAFEVVDLRSFPDEERLEEASKRAQAMVHTPFNLRTDPLLRVVLFHIGNDREVLFLNAHHIIMDLWSGEVIRRDFVEIYRALKEDRESRLPALDLQYVDFAAWQRRWLQHGALHNQMEFWRNKLQNVPVLQFPTDLPRPERRTFHGETLTATFPRQWVERVQQFSQVQGVTPFMALISVFKTTLWRYTGMEDLVVGFPIANRQRFEIENMVGTFVNTVPLRTQPTKDLPFADYLEHVRDEALQAFANQDAPFEQLVAKFAPRQSSHLPLVQIFFDLENIPGESEGPVDYKPLPIEPGSTQFDLSMAIHLSPDQGTLYIHYDTDLFLKASIERFLKIFENVLEAVLADPHQRLCQLPYLSADHRQRLLSTWNATAQDFPEKGNFPQLFERQAAGNPDKIAGIFGDEEISYGALNRKANQLAHHLRGQGLQPDQFVGVYMDRGLDMLVALLGILKAGGAYLPLDPAYPQDRLQFMIEDSAARLILTSDSLLRSLSEISAPLFALDSQWESIAEHPDTDPEPISGPESLAYVIYTSGSTGRPKGVSIPHRALANFLQSMTREPGLEELDRLLAVTTLSFDIAALELYLPLVTGATVVLASRETAQDPRLLSLLMQRHGCNVMQATPSTWTMLLESGWPGSPDLKILCGGEALSPALARQLLPRCKELWNMYGPTETTIWSTIWKVRSDMSKILIGRPIANTQVYILDKSGNPVPEGVTGELFIGGDGLARGYLNRPELTEERFVPNPFRDVPDAKLYRTGDLARWQPDGRVECLGRIDFQVKIRGFRIETGEIEAALTNHPSVTQAVVVAREDLSGGKGLVAYIIGLDGNEAPQPDALRAFLKEILPEYMVPSLFVHIEELPLTPNGKVDTKRLPKPLDDLAPVEQEFTEPRNDLESTLCDIFCEVLGLSRISVKADFFGLGGHSLTATQVASRIRKQLGQEVPLRLLFERPNIAQLAEYLETNQVQAIAPPPLLTRVSRDGDLPLSFAQQRLWMLQQLDPFSAAYHVPFSVAIQGQLDLLALEQALNELASRHEILRTSFGDRQGEPFQEVHPSVSIPLKLHDLQEFAAELRVSQARDLIRADIQKPFDLAQAPLLRVHLMTLEPESHILHLTLHHLVCDAWSVGILLHELATLYNAALTSQPATLPDLDFHYLDFAKWQRNYLQGEVLEHHANYWKQKLGGSLQPLALPTDHVKTTSAWSQGASHSMVLGQNLSKSVLEFSERESASPFMVLLSVLKALLSRLTNQEDISVGSPIAGRNLLPEQETLVGFFINTLVLRTDLSGAPTFQSLVERVKETNLEAYAHQDMPFEKLVEILDPARDLNRSPLFQVFFNHLNLQFPAIELPDLRMEPLLVQDLDAKFDLTIYVIETVEGFQLTAVYPTDLFKPERICNLLDQYKVLLQNCLAFPDRSIQAHPLQTEFSRSLLPGPTHPLDTSQGRPIHEAFSRIAQTDPYSVAIRYQSQICTYSDLDKLSNQLAHALLDANLPANSIVALYANRSPALVWAMLGILKAGRPFLILDHAYPVRRLVTMLEAAKPALLLSIDRQEPLPPDLQQFLDEAEIPWERIPSMAERVPAWIGAHSTAAPDVTVDPDQLAYLMFTSGTSGMPKGVRASHRPLTQFLEWYRDRFNLKPTDRFSMLSGLSHDPLLRDIFTPLNLGATLCIPSPQEMDSPMLLVDWLMREEVSVAHLTPSFATYLSQGIVLEEADAPVSSSLRLAVFAGDVLRPEHVTIMRGMAPEVECINAYGATETPQIIATYCCDTTRPEAVYPIGQAHKEAQVLILNPCNVLAGIGEVGEICVRTPYLSSGYLKEDAADQRFISNPFTGIGDDRIYRTGDLGRYDLSGNAIYLGRADNQLSIQGFRVEPEEVRRALREHPLIQNCALLSRIEGTGEAFLTAFLVPVNPMPEGGALEAAELIAFLRQRLPHYMIPSAYRLIDWIPLMPNGKVDLEALRDREANAVRLQRNFVPPRTALERQLAELYQEVLGLEEVSVTASFFELGGHSLAATRLVSRLRQEFQVDLPLRTLFQHSSVASMAKTLGEKAKDSESSGRGVHETQGSVISMHTEGQGTPLFVFAGAYADEELFLRYLSHMIPYLGIERPVYGLQPKGVDATSSLHDTVEEMARYAIKQIRTIQPEGPYLLCGECVGGIVAYEAGRQLQEEGEDLGALILMDTPKPTLQMYCRYCLSSFFKVLRRNLKNLIWPVLHPQEFAQSQDKIDPEQASRQRAVLTTQIDYRKVLYRYRPLPYPGDLTLIVNEDDNRLEADSGWGDLAQGGLETMEVPGNHLTRLTVYGQQTAAIILSVLEKAESSTRSEP